MMTILAKKPVGKDETRIIGALSCCEQFKLNRRRTLNPPYFFCQQKYIIAQSEGPSAQ